MHGRGTTNQTFPPWRIEVGVSGRIVVSRRPRARRAHDVGQRVVLGGGRSRNLPAILETGGLTAELGWGLVVLIGLLGVE